MHSYIHTQDIHTYYVCTCAFTSVCLHTYIFIYVAVMQSLQNTPHIVELPTPPTEVSNDPSVGNDSIPESMYLCSLT